jgi:cytochrome c oxidase subunit 4
MNTIENEKKHIIPYSTFMLVLAGLIVLTLASVTLTRISLGAFTVAVALLIAGIKSTFVLAIFMHLKFENKMFSRAVMGVILLLGAVITITLLDYLNR